MTRLAIGNMEVTGLTLKTMIAIYIIAHRTAGPQSFIEHSGLMTGFTCSSCYTMTGHWRAGIIRGDDTVFTMTICTYGGIGHTSGCHFSMSTLRVSLTTFPMHRSLSMTGPMRRGWPVGNRSASNIRPGLRRLATRACLVRATNRFRQRRFILTIRHGAQHSKAAQCGRSAPCRNPQAR